jgi:hypothetical protein
VTPRSQGGLDQDARPSHAHCNVTHGAEIGNARKRELIAKGRAVEATETSSRFFPAAIPPEPRVFLPALSSNAPTPPVPADLDSETPGPDDPVWDAAEWLTGVREIPSTATWPRLMTLPHPTAVGSYGQEAIEWAEHRSGKPLRWWQRLVLLRVLEHDEAGALTCWPFVLFSTSRQSGKSWLLRELMLWRIHQSDRFDEPQLVVHTAKDLPVCREVQRPARAWAHQQPHYIVREANGMEEIETPDGSRWIVRGKTSIYGYSASLAVVDEAWAVNPEVIEDGLEPTMAERSSSQIALVSTAHRFATGLMQARRSAAIEQLDNPEDTLLLEWSASASADISDRKAWRLASPHWSDRRERLIESQHKRAVDGVPPQDPSEPDPVASFKSQYLNQWPARPRAIDGRGEPLLDDGLWSALTELSALPTGPLIFGLEDWFGQGAAAAATGHLGDGRLFAWGRTFPRRSVACGWLAGLADAHPGSRLVVGASLEHDPDAAAIPVESRELAGQAQTRTALPLLRELVAANRLAHDGGAELTLQVEGCRVVESRAGGLGVAPGPQRTDLLRAAAWALAVLARLPVPEEEPAIF